MQPITMAVLGGLYTWGMTAMGAAIVFFFTNISKKVLSLMLGLASGIMIAASFWSLLAPAIDTGGPWPALIGFLLGGGFLYICDKTLSHIRKSQRRSALLMLAITLHNVPEGLAVGVAFGSAIISPAAIPAAIALTIGIGIQNFPEGAAVSIPLRWQGLSRADSFWYGQLPGVVEPLSAILGIVMAANIQSLLPYALGFAAGAMIFVVAEELIPEAKASSENGYHATFGLLIGFAVMMILDTLLG